MNNKEFITMMAARTGLKPTEVQSMMDTVVALMGEHFMEGDTVQLPNFGAFEVKKKLERVMVNPATGQRMLVPPKLVLSFKPSPTWKEKIKEGRN